MKPLFLCLLFLACSKDKDENCPPCPNSLFVDGEYGNIHFQDTTRKILSMKVQGENVTLTYEAEDKSVRTAIFKRRDF